MVRINGFGRAGTVVAVVIFAALCYGLFVKIGGMGTIPAAIIFVALCFSEFTKTGVRGTFTDPRDGKKYRTVKMGNKIWMAENLNFKVDNSWYYDNNESNCQKYGRLYDWNAAMEACPPGWRLPTLDDWDDLLQVASGNSLTGKMLKSKTGWRLPDDKEINRLAQLEMDEKEAAEFLDEYKSKMTLKAGTDKYGFSAMPGGYRDIDGSFHDGGYYGSWWSATENGSDYAYHRYMSFGLEYVAESYGDKSTGFSVRCVK